jgi:hypothetical protein
MAKPFVVSRSIAPELRPALRRHARHVGEIIWCWNLLHQEIFLMFGYTINVPQELRSFDLAYGIWHTIQSDKTQREMLEASAKARFGPVSSPATGKPVQSARDKRALACILWITKMAGQLSAYRNDPAHSPVYFAMTAGSTYADPNFAPVPTGIGRRAAVERLRSEPTAEVWRKARGDLYVLARYAVGVRLAIHSNGRAPWPRKPRLLCLPASAQRSIQAARRLSHAKPRSPPPA